MTYLDINIPSKIFYALIGSETLRIARTITNLINMVTRINPFLIRMIKQGSDCTCIS